MSALTTEPRDWKRIGYVAIENDRGGFDTYGGEDSLDFKFDGTISAEICPKFVVSILGLSKETMAGLTVWNPIEAFSRSRQIRVYAGYENDNIEKPIFDGIICEAFPTQPPEAWMNFKCILNYLSKDIPQIDIPESPKTLGEIAEQIAILCGRSMKWNAVRTSKDFSASFNFDKTSPYDLVLRFNEKFDGLIMYVDEEGVITVIDNYGERNAISGGIQTISIDNGMLGLNNITMIGARVIKRLDPDIKCFSWINVESRLVNKANGSYYVVYKRHVGHFRGQEWYTQLDTHRKKF